MEDAAPVAQEAVRDHLDEVEGWESPEHRASQGDLPAVLEHPHLAPILGLVGGRGPLEGVRRRLVDRPPPRLDHAIREGEIVAPARVDLDVVTAVQRVDRAVAPGDRAERRLGLAQPHLVAPVQPLPVVALRRLESQLPADVGDIGIGQVRDEPAQRVGRPARIRIGEGDDIALGRANGSILGGHLASPRAVQKAHPGLAGRHLRHEVVRSVGRRVRGDDDRQLLGGSPTRAGSRAAARSRAPRCGRPRRR